MLLGKLKNLVLGKSLFLGNHFWEKICFKSGKVATKYRRCLCERMVTKVDA